MCVKPLAQRLVPNICYYYICSCHSPFMGLIERLSVNILKKFNISEIVSTKYQLLLPSLQNRPEIDRTFVSTLWPSPSHHLLLRILQLLLTSHLVLYPPYYYSLQLVTWSLHYLKLFALRIVYHKCLGNKDVWSLQHLYHQRRTQHTANTGSFFFIIKVLYSFS